MDYETKPTSRSELRLYAKLFRSICGFNMTEAIDPVELLDRLPDLEGFGNVHYDIVEDEALPGKVPAQCNRTNDGYMILIKDSVYDGAHKKKTGGHRMYIMHEIMHAYADLLGFHPIFSRQLSSDTPIYRRLEWVVKALAGEVMMPYEATQDMTADEIIQTYGVSKDAAKIRLTY